MTIIFVICLILLSSGISASTSTCRIDSVDDGFAGHFSVSSGNFDPRNLTAQDCPGLCSMIHVQYSAMEEVLVDQTSPPPTSSAYAACLCSAHISVSSLQGGTCHLCTDGTCWGAHGNLAIVASSRGVTSLELSLNIETVAVAAPVTLTGIADVQAAEFTVNQGDGSPPFTIPASSSSADRISQPIAYNVPGHYTITVTCQLPGTPQSETAQVSLSVYSPLALNEFSCDTVATPGQPYYCSVDAVGSSVQATIDGGSFALVESVWEYVGTPPPSAAAGLTGWQTLPLADFRIAQPVGLSGHLKAVTWLGHTTGQCQAKIMRPRCSAGSICDDQSHFCCDNAVSLDVENQLTCPQATPILCPTFYQCVANTLGTCSSTPAISAIYEPASASFTIDIEQNRSGLLNVPDGTVVERGDVVQVECTTGRVASIESTSGDLDLDSLTTQHHHLISAIIIPSQATSSEYSCQQPLTTIARELELSGPGGMAVSSRAETQCQIPVTGLTMERMQQDDTAINFNTTPVFVSTALPINISVSVAQGAPVLFSWDFGDPTLSNITKEEQLVLTSAFWHNISVHYSSSGVYNLVCSATNLHPVVGDNDTVTMSISAQHPILRDWNLIVYSQTLIDSIHEPMEPSTVFIRVQLAENLQLPTDAFITVDFGDGFAFTAPKPLSEFRLFDNTSTDAATSGYFSIELDHNYYSEGLYNISVTMFNEISEHYMQAEVDIHERIKGLEVTFKFQLDDTSDELEYGLGEEMNQFHNDKNVTFHFEMAQGTATQYVIYNTSSTPMESIGVFNISDKYNPCLGNFYWWFDQNHELNLSVVAVDDFQQSEPAVATLVITDPLQSVGAIKIVEGSEVVSSGQDKRINVTFSAQSLYWLCLTVDYGDGSPTAAYGDEKICQQLFAEIRFMPSELDNPMELSHTYWRDGLFNVTVYLANELSMVTDMKIIPIISFPCPRPGLSIADISGTLEKATPYFRSSKVTVESRITLDCDVELAVEKVWKIIRVNDSSGEMLEVIPIEGLLNTWNKSSLLIKSNFLDFGVYKLEYTLSLWKASIEKPVLPLVASIQCYIKICRSPLKAVIVQGSVSKLVRGWGQTIDLNPGENSIDPDDAFNKTFEIEWYCKQLGEELPRNGSEYDSSQTQNIPASNGVMNSPLGAGGCVGKGPGKLKFSEARWNLNTGVLRPYGVGITYVIVVVIRKDERRAESSLELEMISGKPPMMSIACSNEKLCSPTDGGVYVNPGKRLALLATCMDDCFPPLTYQWDIKAIDNETNIMSIDNVEQFMLTPPIHNEISISSFIFGNFSHIEKFQLSLLANNSHESKKTGSASFYLIVNKPPDVQSSLCQISKMTGFALIDIFTFNCQPARDPEHHSIVRYTFYLRISNMALGVTRQKTLPSSRFPTLNMRLPYGNVTILYDVVDSLGSKSTKTVVTISTKMPSREEYMKVMAGKPFTDAAKLGNATELLMIMLAAESIREEAAWAQPGYVPPGEDASDAQSAVSDQNFNAIVGLTNIPLDNEASLNMASNGMSSVLSSSVGSEQASLQIDSRTRSGTLDLAESIANSVDEAGFSTPDDFAGIVGDITSTFTTLSINQAMIVNDKQCKSVPSADLQRAEVLDYETVIGDYDTETSIPDPDKQKACNVRDSVVLQTAQLANTIENVVGKFKHAVLKEMVVGEEVIINNNGAALMLKMTQNASTMSIAIDNSDGKVDMDEFCPTGNCSDSVGVEVVQFPTNIRSSSSGSQQISPKSSVISIEVRTRNLSALSVDSLAKPIRIVIPQSKKMTTSNGTNSNNCSQCPVSSVYFDANEAIKNNILPLIYSQFTVEQPESSIVIEFMPVSSIGANIVTLVAIGYMPTLNRYDFVRMLHDYPERESINETTSVVSLYRWLINSTIVANRTGRAFLAVGQYRYNISEGDYLPMLGSDTNPIYHNATLSWTFTTNFYIRTYTAGCYYYNEREDQWTSYGMTVVAANYGAVTCESTHLSSFSSGMFVQPNVIDFSYVFANASFTDNLTIYMTIIVFGIVMVLLCIWARWQDKKDLSCLGALPLSDNQPNNKYIYEVTVYTGHRSNAATTSQVSFILSGSEDNTDIRTFGKGKRSFFRKGGKDTFIMTCQQPLGNINYIRIWHDNTGLGRYASWYVLYIHVRDVHTNDNFTFVINDWLAIDEADGSLERVEAVADDKQLKAFSHLFSHSSQRNLSDNHLWFSVFLRPPTSRFTRLQRVVCCFTLLFLSMMVNAMWYGTVPSKPSSGSLQFGPMSLSPEQIFVGIMSNLIVFPPSFIIVFLFRKSRSRLKRKSHIDEALDKQPFGNNIGINKRRQSRLSKNSVPTKNKGFTLPWWCSIVAWIISLVCLFGAVFITWSYGIQFGNEKTSKWLSALIMSFFSSIMLVQPIKVFLIAMFVSSIFKSFKLDSDDNLEDELEPTLCDDEEWLFATPNESQKSHFSRPKPLNEDVIRKMKQRRQNELEMNAMIKEMLSYFLFLFILYFLSYDNRDPNAFYLKQSLENSFIKRGDNTFLRTDLDFSKVQNATRFWHWSRNVLLNNLRAQNWYNGITPPYGLRGFLDDRVNRIIGFGLVRQIRSKSHTCTLHPSIESLSDSCSGFTNVLSEESRDFCVSWKETGNISQCQRPEYHYTTAKQLKNLPFWANINVYGGGGYVLSLKGRTVTLKEKMTQLEAENWIDDMTRAVFVQFSVYNAQVNLFGIVNIFVEQIPGGGLRPGWRIEGVRLIRHPAGFQWFTLVIELSYIGFIIYFIVREVRLIIRQRSSYFHSYWSYAEWSVILLSIAAVVVFALRHWETLKILSTFQTSHGNAYVQLEYAKSMDDIFGYIFCAIVFIATIKFTKLLRFNRRIGILSVTLKQCWEDLTGFFVIFIIIMITFSAAFNLLLISHMEEFSTFMGSVNQCFAMLMNRFDFDKIHSSNRLAAFVFIGFAFISTLIFVNLLLTIVIRAFNTVKSDVKKQPNDYELLDYIKFRLSSMLGWGSRRISPENKPDEMSQTSYQHLPEVMEEKLELLRESLSFVYMRRKNSRGGILSGTE